MSLNFSTEKENKFELQRPELLAAPDNSTVFPLLQVPEMVRLFEFE